jgi:hypothetical protein
MRRDSCSLTFALCACFSPRLRSQTERMRSGQGRQRSMRCAMRMFRSMQSSTSTLAASQNLHPVVLACSASCAVFSPV